MVTSLLRSPPLPCYCRQLMGSRHSHSHPAGSCLSMYVLRVSLESSRCSQHCSSRTMLNLSQHLSSQPPVSAPCTWTQSQSRPENGKKPSDPVQQQLLFIYPGSFLRRRDEVLPTPLVLTLQERCEVRGMPQRGVGLTFSAEQRKDRDRFGFSQRSTGARGKPTSVCGGAGPAPVSCGGGRWRKPAAGLQTHASPRRRQLY